MSNVKYLELKRSKTTLPKASIKQSNDAYDYIKQFYNDDIEIYESSFILLLNKGNNVIGYAKISQGGVSTTIIDKAIVAKYAIESLASGVIIAHNHPSGNLNPSEQDKKITKEITDGLNLFDITLLDHIILTSTEYYSFKDNSLI